MPLEDALVLMVTELRSFSLNKALDFLRAGELIDDFLVKDYLDSYSVLSGIWHLLFLLNEGKHFYRADWACSWTTYGPGKSNLKNWPTQMSTSNPLSFFRQLL